MQHLTLPDRLEVSFLTKDHIVPRGSHFEFRPRYNAYFKLKSRKRNLYLWEINMADHVITRRSAKNATLKFCINQH